MNSRPIVIVPSNNDQSNDIQLEDLSSSHLIRQRRRNRFKRFRYSFKRNRLERKWLLGEADYTDIKAGTQNSKDTKVIRLPILASIFEAWPESLDVMMDGECNVKQAWREAIEDAEIELTLSDVGGISIGLEYDVCDLQVLDVSEFMLFL